VRALALCFVRVFILFASAPALAATERIDLRGRYFIVVWGYQGAVNAPKDSHTFASFYDGTQLSRGRVKPATISWLPVTGVVHILEVDPGRNFSLGQTLTLACRSGRQVGSWGPYEIDFDLYQRALTRIRLLHSGTIRFSSVPRQGKTMNCIEATGDIAETPFRPGLVWGSEQVRRLFDISARYSKMVDGSMAQRQGWSCGTNAVRAQIHCHKPFPLF
jgi:hypothetical protein